MLSPRHRAPESLSWACFPAADPHKVPIDSNGNLTTKTEGSDNWVYEWNAENQLTRVTKNGIEVARFGYDAKGRRVEKVAGSLTTTYTYDGADIVRETRSDGSTFKYVHGQGIDEWLGRQNADNSLTYFVADALGSIAAETNGAGQVTLARTYDAWGNLDATSAAVGGPAFTGREWDTETGLYYYRARYYDPGNGRFVSADPIGFRGGVNLYVYADDSPTTRVDPLGLAATKEPSYYYVCCWRGRMSICGGDLTLKDSCLRKCALDHEAMHLEDFRSKEDWCKCKKDKTPVEQPTTDVYASECRAWKYMLECISKCAPSAEKTSIYLDGTWGRIPTYCGNQP